MRATGSHFWLCVLATSPAAHGDEQLDLRGLEAAGAVGLSVVARPAAAAPQPHALAAPPHSRTHRSTPARLSVDRAPAKYVSLAGDGLGTLRRGAGGSIAHPCRATP